MKTSAQINIERLTKIDREILTDVLRGCTEQAQSLGFVKRGYEGALHTALDRIELELGDAIERLASLLGQKQLELLSGSDRLNEAIKTSLV